MVKKYFFLVLSLVLAANIVKANDITGNGEPSDYRTRVIEIESSVSDTVFAKVVVLNSKTSLPDTILTEVRFVKPKTASPDSLPGDVAAIELAADTDSTAIHDEHHSPWAPKPKWGPQTAKFAWGAEVGSTIDMSGNEMSSIDFSASFGLHYKWLSFAGIGVGANIMVNNSYRTYPIYVDLRTDFSKLVKFLFIDFRGGVALNYLERNMRQTGAYVSPSIGFNLASGETFRSYLTLGYTFISRKDIHRGEEVFPYKSLSLATVRLGVAF